MFLVAFFAIGIAACGRDLGTAGDYLDEGSGNLQLDISETDEQPATEPTTPLPQGYPDPDEGAEDTQAVITETGEQSEAEPTTRLPQDYPGSDEGAGSPHAVISETDEQPTVKLVSPLPQEVQMAGLTYHHANFNISIAHATDILLANFEQIHEMDYYEVRGVPQGDRLVIWADVTLHDFAVVNLSPDSVGDEVIYYHTSIHGKVDSLLPRQAFVVNNYAGVGTLPWSGIVFTDATDERHYFAMMHDHSDSFNHFTIWPIEIATGN